MDREFNLIMLIAKDQPLKQWAERIIEERPGLDVIFYIGNKVYETEELSNTVCLKDFPNPSIPRSSVGLYRGKLTPNADMAYFKDKLEVWVTYMDEVYSAHGQFGPDATTLFSEVLEEYDRELEKHNSEWPPLQHFDGKQGVCPCGEKVNVDVEGALAVPCPACAAWFEVETGLQQDGKGLEEELEWRLEEGLG